MAELDWVVGELLAKLDELGIADNTIVLFTSDNGAEIFSWPDGGNHPFRGEKGTVYEGGFRVPMLAKWPGVIEPGIIVNEVMAAEDWLPTLVAAAGGDPDIKEKLLTGYQVGGKTFKNHLDGYNFKPFFEGTAAESPRREFFYFSDNADLMALRYNQWKITFKTIVGNLFSGKEGFDQRADRDQTCASIPGNDTRPIRRPYGEWWGKKLWVMMPATMIMGKFLATFKDYPPSQASGSLSVEKALAALQEGGRKN